MTRRDINATISSLPYRFTPLVNGEYYHVYNRGIASQPIYLSIREYERFLLCLSYYRFNNLPFKLSRLLQISRDERDQILSNLKLEKDLVVEIVAYCLMPNHFHLLLQQKTNGGISKFVKLIADSYTRYFNTKRERVGPIFQGAFKAVHVRSDEQLVHLSRYIHLNPLVSFVVSEKNFLNYPWSSLKNYLYPDSPGFVNPGIVLDTFKNPQDYFDFVMDQADYGKELKRIKHLIMEV